MSDRPLCFIVMPFGMKKDPGGGPDINFDTVFDQAIRPAVEAAGMEPIRADEERTGGIIHQAMFERLLLCEYAVADLTTANANVFYELGVRHAARPATTLSIFASQQRLPFDVNFLRALPYELAEGNKFGPEQAEKLRTALTTKLKDVRDLSIRQAAADSPVFQLLKDYGAPDIARLKTDSFREKAEYSVGLKRALAEARERRDVEAIAEIERRLEPFDRSETGVLVDLYLSYRALQQWDRMIGLYERLPVVLQRSIMMREQLGFALNRRGEKQRALEILEGVVQEQGPSSETCGLIGRVYKDQWMEARKAGSGFQARGYLDKAIASYVRGFEADWRDAYPGINAVTLLDVKGDEKSLQRKAEILPVVRFAVTQRLRSSKPDYWDHATLLELAVLDQDLDAVQQSLGDALACVREKWEPATTANNLKLIQEARQARGAAEDWLDEVIGELEKAAES
jgi:tetratricopeptide (TPR) repeat protein